MKVPPWGLAAAAREGLLYGNEYRSKPLEGQWLAALMRKYQIAIDIGDADAQSADFLVSFMTRATYEQFPYQESMFEELARSQAWMVDGLVDVDTKVITESSLADMLGGVPVREAIGATFFLQVGAAQNGGTFNATWLAQPNFVEVLKIYPRSTIEAMAARLTTTPSDFKDAFQRYALGTTAAARYDYNPLVATPFVDFGDGLPVAPATRLILRTVTPGGLYYAGMAAHGNDFAGDLGKLFEHYVGRQLATIDVVELHPEIVYGKGGGNKSVDWFVVFPGLVLLVEIKSRRLGPAARAGGTALMESLAETLGGARRQLTRTVERLTEGHAAFAHIPTDRPMLGLIVTAEPYYTGSAFLLDHDVALIPGGGLPDVPVAAVSARDIEGLVTHGADVEGLLLDQIATRGDGVVGLRAVGKKAGAENKILTDAWESYPWPSGAP
jgi:hypothetical protein